MFSLSVQVTIQNRPVKICKHYTKIFNNKNCYDTQIYVHDLGTLILHSPSVVCSFLSNVSKISRYTKYLVTNRINKTVLTESQVV